MAKNNNHIYIKITTVPETAEKDSKQFEMFYDKYLTTKQFADYDDAYKSFQEDAHKHYLFGKIYSITIATVLIDESGSEKIGIKVLKGDENNVLKAFYNLYTEDLFKESKSTVWRAEFVLPFIAMRAIKNGIKTEKAPDLNPFNKRIWNISCLCLHEYIKGVGYFVPSLEEVAYIFGVEVDTIESAKVNYLLRAGETDTIDESSISEVNALVNIHRKLLNLEIIEDKVVNVVTLEKAVEVIELPLLEKLYNTGQFTEEHIKELNIKLKGITEEEKPHVIKIILAHYLQKKDKVADKKRKTQEVTDFINSL